MSRDGQLMLEAEEVGTVGGTQRDRMAGSVGERVVRASAKVGVFRNTAHTS